MRIDLRDPDHDWTFYQPYRVIDADTGFMIDQVVAVDDEEGWIVVHVCDKSGMIVIDQETDEIVLAKLHRPVKIIDIRTVPNDQRRGVVNLTQTY